VIKMDKEDKQLERIVVTDISAMIGEPIGAALGAYYGPRLGTGVFDGACLGFIFGAGAGYVAGQWVPIYRRLRERLRDINL
jgi:outer membrane lipoprotein SlyB